LCRIEQKRVVDPENFLPKLPQREELRPFPTVIGMEYLGHSKRVRSVSFDPTGQFFASGSEDCTVRIWEVLRGIYVVCVCGAAMRVCGADTDWVLLRCRCHRVGACAFTTRAPW
jgi:WD40 repeat protein